MTLETWNLRGERRSNWVRVCVIADGPTRLFLRSRRSSSSQAKPSQSERAKAICSTAEGSLGRGEARGGHRLRHGSGQGTEVRGEKVWLGSTRQAHRETQAESQKGNRQTTDYNDEPRLGHLVGRYHCFPLLNHQSHKVSFEVDGDKRKTATLYPFANSHLYSLAHQQISRSLLFSSPSRSPLSPHRHSLNNKDEAQLRQPGHWRPEGLLHR